jgi:hypothetical protein
MATDYNFDDFKPISGTTDYVSKYDAFITALEEYATEEENAREGYANLLVNLQTDYLGYTLGQNLDGASDTYKCTNMAPGSNDNDYITILQANSLSGTIAQNIEDVSVGSLLPNDILVIEPGGNFIEGRSTKYTTIPGTCEANGNYDMALSSSKITNLPAGSEGMVISFADLDGNASISTTLTIKPNGSEKIMAIASDSGWLIVDDYPYCSFDLVYTNDSAFGWTLARFQR